MNTEVVKVETQLPALAPAQTLDEIGMSAQDIQVDRLLLMQATSEAVGDDVQKTGDMILNNTGEMLAPADGQLELIPLKLFKTWRIMDMTKKPPEFVREEPMTAANEKNPWEFTEKDDQGKMADRRRDYGLHFFCLLANDLERFPILISFRRTSAKAGKALATILFKQAALRRPLYAKTATLTVGKDKFGTNTYAFYQIAPGKPTAPDGLAAAAEWVESKNGNPPLIEGLKSRVDWSRDKDADERAAGGPAMAPTVISEDAPGTATEGLY